MKFAKVIPTLLLLSSAAQANAILDVHGDIQINGKTVIDSTGKWVGSGNGDEGSSGVSDAIVSSDYDFTDTNSTYIYLYIHDAIEGDDEFEIVRQSISSEGHLTSEYANKVEVETSYFDNSQNAMVFETTTTKNGKETVSSQYRREANSFPTLREIGKTYGRSEMTWEQEEDGEWDVVRLYREWTALATLPTWKLDFPQEILPELEEASGVQIDNTVEYKDCIIYQYTRTFNSDKRTRTACKNVGVVEEMRERVKNGITEYRTILLVGKE